MVMDTELRLDQIYIKARRSEKASRLFFIKVATTLHGEEKLRAMKSGVHFILPEGQQQSRAVIVLHPAGAPKNILLLFPHISLINPLANLSCSHRIIVTFRLTSVGISLHIAPTGVSGTSIQIKHPPTAFFFLKFQLHPIMDTVVDSSKTKKQSRRHLTNSNCQLHRGGGGGGGGGGGVGVFGGGKAESPSSVPGFKWFSGLHHIPAWISSWLADVHLSPGLIYTPAQGWSEEGG